MGMLSKKKDKSAKLAQREAAANQRRQLASLAQQSAQTDMASQPQGGRKRGRTLLTMMNAGAAA